MNTLCFALPVMVLLSLDPLITIAQQVIYDSTSVDTSFYENGILNLRNTTHIFIDSTAFKNGSRISRTKIRDISFPGFRNDSLKRIELQDSVGVLRGKKKRDFNY